MRVRDAGNKTERVPPPRQQKKAAAAAAALDGDAGVGQHRLQLARLERRHRGCRGGGGCCVEGRGVCAFGWRGVGLLARTHTQAEQKQGCSNKPRRTVAAADVRAADKDLRHGLALDHLLQRQRQRLALGCAFCCFFCVVARAFV